MYSDFASGEHGVDCPCGEGMGNFKTVVGHESYKGEMKVCQDCGRKIILYGDKSGVRTAVSPDQVLKAQNRGLKKAKPYQHSIDQIKLDILSVIADYQTNNHWIWDKESLDGYYIYSNQSHYIGFIYWTLGRKPVLHSLFVEESRRRKGYGTRMVEDWISKFGNNTEFEVLDPEEKVMNLLEKLDVQFEVVGS